MKSVILALLASVAFTIVLANNSPPAEALPPQYYWHCTTCMGDRCYRVEDGSSSYVIG